MNEDLKLGDSVRIPGIPLTFTIASLHLDAERQSKDEKYRAMLFWWNEKEQSINTINVAAALINRIP